MHAIAQTIIGSGDTELMRALVTEKFAPHRLRVVQDRPEPGSLGLVHRGDLSLFKLEYGAQIQLDLHDMPEIYHLHIPLSGGGRMTVEGREVPSPTNLLGPGQRVWMDWTLDHDVLIVQIPRYAIDRALAQYLGDTPATLTRFEPLVDVSGPVGGLLETTRAFAAHAGDLAATSPLAVHHFEQFLLHGLLTAQPHNHSAAMATWHGRAPTAALRRAMTYCEEHAHEPISTADIAAAARVSVRAIQQAFREQLQTTPLVHLRQRRLERAHQDLLAAAASGAPDTVTEIALRWGFTHLGRFSAQYRAKYGHSPSATLRGEPPTGVHDH